jgi:hypothetical protein
VAKADIAALLALANFRNQCVQARRRLFFRPRELLERSCPRTWRTQSKGLRHECNPCSGRPSDDTRHRFATAQTVVPQVWRSDAQVSDTGFGISGDARRLDVRLRSSTGPEGATYRWRPVVEWCS